MNMLIKKVSIGRGSSFEGSCFSNTEDQAHCWFPAGAHKDFGRLGHKAQIRPRALGISRFKPKLMGWEVRGSFDPFRFPSSVRDSVGRPIYSRGEAVRFATRHYDYEGNGLVINHNQPQASPAIGVTFPTWVMLLLEAGASIG